MGEYNEAWLDGIDERLRKIRVAEDANNNDTAFVLKGLRKKVKATGVRTTFWTHRQGICCVSHGRLKMSVAFVF